MNQEKKPSPYLQKVLKKIAETSNSPAKALSSVFPVRMGLHETGEAGGYFNLKFTEKGYSVDSDNLMISTGTDHPPTKVDGMLAVALFLLDAAEYELALYQAEVFCTELEKLVNAGSIQVNPDEEIPDHIFQLVMVNASNTAYEENQVPEGVTIQ